MIGRTNAVINMGEQPFVPPDDNSYILLTTHATPSPLAYRLIFYVTKSDTSTLSIDWGDGNTETVTASGTTTVTHDYTTYGDMVVKLWISSGIGTYHIGGSTSLTPQPTYVNHIRQIFIGKNNWDNTILTSNFRYCIALNKCVIPDTIVTMGSTAFYDLQQPISITINATTPPVLSSASPTLFNNAAISTLTRIAVPAASLDTYKTATNWSAYEAYMEAIEE